MSTPLSGYVICILRPLRLTGRITAPPSPIGTLAYQTECLNCHTVTERKEKYYDLLLQVLGCRDTATSLRGYAAPELLHGSNKYACDVCCSKQDAHRRVAIKSAPPLLTISCQRFDIDRTTWQRVKVTTKCEFPLTMVTA